MEKSFLEGSEDEMQNDLATLEETGSVCVASDVSAGEGTPSIYSVPETSKIDENFLPDHEVIAEITDVERMPRTHPFNPNLYTIRLKHCGFEWTIRRRYKHFLKLDAELFLLKLDPRRKLTPASRGHHHHLPRLHLPHKPDPLATTSHMKDRVKSLEKYLQNVLKNKEYRNHKETLNFLEVSHLSFMHDLGGKGREGTVKKSSGGHRFPRGCCSCSATMSCGIWTKRWLLLKDSFVTYIDPKTKQVGGVILIDRDFTFKYGRKETAVRHGLIIRNESRELLLSCWTDRKASEWMKSIVSVMASTGSEWMSEQPHQSFAPVRPGCYSK